VHKGGARDCRHFAARCRHSICLCDKCCGIIQTAITQYTKFKNKVYHKECLKCKNCNKSLQGSFAFRNNDLYCLNCVGTCISLIKHGSFIAAAPTKSTPVPDQGSRGRTTTKIGGPRAEPVPMVVLQESKPAQEHLSQPPANDPYSTMPRERTVTNWNFSKGAPKPTSTMQRSNAPMLSRVRVDSPTVTRSNTTNLGKSNSPLANGQSDIIDEQEIKLKPEEEVERLLQETREKKLN